MACYDGSKAWGANQLWETAASIYVAVAHVWSAFGRVTAKLGTYRTADLLDHVRHQIRAHGDETDLADLEAAEAELAERRARKGGRPRKSTPES